MTRLLCAAILCCCVPSLAFTQPTGPNKKGWFTSAKLLKYKAYSPRSSRARPGLILFIHGDNGHHILLEKEYLKPCLAAGFVVVTPRSTAFSLDPNASSKSWQAVDDAKLIALTKALAKSYRVDRTRVYMLGIGNGNIGGNLVFTNPDLFTGCVALGGGPEMIGPNWKTLSDTQKKDMGLFIIAGAQDPQLASSQRSRDAAKKAGIVDTQYKEIGGLGHAIKSGSYKMVAPWLAKRRRAFVPGNVKGILWAEEGTDPEDKWRLVYAYGSGKKHRDGCQTLEWDVLTQSDLVTKAAEMHCRKIDLKSSSGLLSTNKVRSPTILIVSPKGEVKLKLDAKKVGALYRKARGRHPEQRYPLFVKLISAEIDKAMK